MFSFSSRRRHTRLQGGWSSCVCCFFSSRRRHTRLQGDWSSDVCSSDLVVLIGPPLVEPCPVAVLGIGGTTTTNTATGQGSTSGGPISTTPSSASYTIFAPPADLAITKTDGVASVTAGGGTTYTVTVTNNGPSDVTNATVTDTAPANVTFGAWTCSVSNPGSGGSVTTACGAASGSGNLATTATMQPGAVIIYTVPATISAGATGTIANTATVAVPAGTT